MHVCVPQITFLFINVLKSVCSRSMASKTPVGFIGLGNMGNPMAKNLMKHGYPLILYDVFPDVCKEFKEAGEQVRLGSGFALDFVFKFFFFFNQRSKYFLEAYPTEL